MQQVKQNRVRFGFLTRLRVFFYGANKDCQFTRHGVLPSEEGFCWGFFLHLDRSRRSSNDRLMLTRTVRSDTLLFQLIHGGGDKNSTVERPSAVTAKRQSANPPNESVDRN